jgi:hypothetical protein
VRAEIVPSSSRGDYHQALAGNPWLVEVPSCMVNLCRYRMWWNIV